MSGEAIYREICQASDLDAAVSRLDRDALAEVAEYLSGLEPRGGVPSQVFGVVSAKLSKGAKLKARRTRK
jgi:hypothetical protein